MVAKAAAVVKVAGPALAVIGGALDFAQFNAKYHDPVALSSTGGGHGSDAGRDLGRR
jgi:hypothetical protein